MSSSVNSNGGNPSNHSAGQSSQSNENQAPSVNLSGEEQPIKVEPEAVPVTSSEKTTTSVAPVTRSANNGQVKDKDLGQIDEDSSTTDGGLKRTADEIGVQHGEARSKKIKKKVDIRQPDNLQKHRPVCPPGTEFALKDNRHINETKLKVGKVDRSMLKLKLKCTKGKMYTWKYTKRHSINLEDKHQVADADKWRRQIFKRRLHRNDSPVTPRPHWSEKEKASLSGMIKARINKKNGPLVVADWNKISNMHNARWVGAEVKVGEKLPGHKNAKGVMSKDRVLKRVHKLPARTSTSIKAQVKKWPDIMQMIDTEVAKYTTSSPSSESSDEPAVKDEPSGEEDSDTSSIDADLEGGDSDDEKDGQRPASTQNGARPIEASG